jgi:hypothetical protein
MIVAIGDVVSNIVDVIGHLVVAVILEVIPIHD